MEIFNDMCHIKWLDFCYKHSCDMLGVQYYNVHVQFGALFPICAINMYIICKVYMCLLVVVDFFNLCFIL